MTGGKEEERRVLEVRREGDPAAWSSFSTADLCRGRGRSIDVRRSCKLDRVFLGDGRSLALVRPLLWAGHKQVQDLDSAGHEPFFGLRVMLSARNGSLVL